MRHAIIALTFLGFITACGQEATQQDLSVTELLTAELTPTQALNQWLDERYEEELSRSPMTLTVLGRKEMYDQVDDASEAAEEELLQWRAQTVESLKADFNYEELSSDGKVSYDLWVYQYENSLAMAPFKRHGYIFDQMNGAHSSLPTFLINYHTVANEAEMRAYISRISGISRALDQLLVRAQLGAQAGVRPPQFAYEVVIAESGALISGVPFDAESETDAPLWADAKLKIEALVDRGDITEALALELLAEVEAALIENFKPSYAALITWLDNDFDNADVVARGVGALNNGEAFYNASLANMTTTSLTADEIHNIGLQEVARITAEMEILKAEVGFNGSLQGFFTFIKTDSSFLYPNDDEGRNGYLNDSTDLIEIMKTKLPEYFGMLPKADLVVKRVEAFREQDGAAQHYMNGSPDGERPGVYYAHLSDMNQMPKDTMETIAYHEGIPGHHMQISIQQELTAVPEFRKQISFTSYVEGWALYAEFLSKEMGGYEDPYKDFGRLTAEIWRAIRLVVDTGIHAQGWSEEQAVNYFKENSPISDGQIRSEVQRYFVMPGQATSYKIGMMKILELRRKAEAALGEQFDIRSFHDVVLGGGSVPLVVLENMLDEWISGTTSMR